MMKRMQGWAIAALGCPGCGTGCEVLSGRRFVSPLRTALEYLHERNVYRDKRDA